MPQRGRELRGIRQPCRAVFTYSVPHRGEKIKIHGRALCPVLACGDYFFVEEGFQIQRKRLHFWEKGRTHTYFVIPDCRGIRHHGRETPDKRIYQTG